MNVCACVRVLCACASFMIDVSCRRKNCIKTAIILAFTFFFTTLVWDREVTSSHAVLIVTMHIVSGCRIHWCRIFHWWSRCTYPIYTAFHNIKDFKNYYFMNATHAVFQIVFLQKKMNKLDDWNPCQCKNDIHLFIKWWWWNKGVAYLVQRTNWKEFSIVWQCIRWRARSRLNVLELLGSCKQQIYCIVTLQHVYWGREIKVHCGCLFLHSASVE